MMAPGPVLRDIHLPPPPDWWPPTYGWWLLIGVMLLTLVFAWVLCRRRWRRYRRWCHLRDVLQNLRSRQHELGADGWLAAELSQLLRRAARERDAQASTLQGDAWHACLQQLAPAGQDLTPLHALQNAVFQRQPQYDSEAALDTAQVWLRHVLTGRGAC